jgi:gluconolactonase
VSPSGYDVNGMDWNPAIREPGTNGLFLARGGSDRGGQRRARHLPLRPRHQEATVLVDHYMDKRLNTPNDCATGPDGSIYFTDPPYRPA